MARISSKLERAVQALLVLRGKATWDNCFISNDSRIRAVLPNKTIVAVAQMNVKSWRPEAWIRFEIQHRFPAKPEIGQSVTMPARAMDNFVADTETEIFGFDSQPVPAPGQEGLPGLATAITNCGRWWATPDPAGPNTPAPFGTTSAESVLENADMANFRCDEVKVANPFLTRGHATEHNGTFWMEIIHLDAFVSDSSGDSN